MLSLHRYTGCMKKPDVFLFTDNKDPL